MGDVKKTYKKQTVIGAAPAKGTPPSAAAPAAAPTPPSTHYIQIENQFAKSPIALRILTMQGRPSYVLMHHDRGNPEKTPGLVIGEYSNDAPSILTAKGVLVPLPFGFEADRIAPGKDIPILQLKELAFGEKKQCYVFIPLHPASDLDELGFTTMAFDSIRAGLDRRKIYKLLDIDMASGVSRFPVYRIVATDNGHQAPLAIGRKEEPSTRPLFRMREQPVSPTITPSLSPADLPTPVTPENAPNPFSFGSLNVRGAQVCFVVDASGSMADKMLKASKGLDILYEKLPAITYPFVKLGAMTTSATAAQAPLSLMSVATLGQLRSVFASPSFQGDTEDLKIGIDRCRQQVTPDPDGGIFKGIVVLTDKEAEVIPTQSGVYLLPLDGDLATLSLDKKIPDIVATMFASPVAPEPLAQRLRKAGVPEDRAKAVAEVMAPLEPIGADQRSSLYTKVMGGWREVMTAVTNADLPKISEILAARADHPERVTQFAVAALRLVPNDVTLFQQLLKMEKEDHDLPLMQEVRRTLTALRGQISHEDRAVLYLAQLRRNPNSITVADILDCGRTPTALRALLHVIKYGSEEAAALEGLASLYATPNATPLERTAMVDALGLKYATATPVDMQRYEAAATQLGITAAELKGDAP